MSSDSSNLPSIVLYTAAPWNSAVVTLRVTGPAKQAGIKVIKGNEGARVFPEFVAEADLVVIQRDFPRFWQDYKQVVSKARSEGKPVIYDLDDLLVEIPGEHSHAGDYMGELLAMLYAILDADIVTASSSPLVEYLSELNATTRLVKNYLNDELWQIKPPKASRREGDKITIGYMGGQTHQADLTIIENALLQVCEKFPDQVELRFWGAQPPAKLLDLPISEWIDINQEDYASFAEYFSDQDCDVFIAPLKDNEFNHAKSSLKYLEYSALGIPGVYSQLPPYESIVVHGENGFLADSETDWTQYLTVLIEEPELCFEIGTAAQKTILDGWLLSKNFVEWSEVLSQALSRNLVQSQQSFNRKNLLRIISHAEDYQANLESSLFQVSNQLNDILESRSWKFLKSLQNLRLRIIPKGGRLDQLLFGGGQ